MNDAETSAASIRVDIVSDVMCPWCIVGYLQLAAAMQVTGIGVGLRWHPYELNPDMGPEGQNLTEHITGKYGITAEDSARNRARLTEIGEGLGFAFRFTTESRMRNSFRAHQLVDWAETQGAQHRMKLALFAAHFSDGLNVDDPATLAELAATLGLDAGAAGIALESGAHARQVRAKQAFWREQGISGVPAMLFQQRYLVTGAQGVETYARLLHELAAQAA